MKTAIFSILIGFICVFGLVSISKHNKNKDQMLKASVQQAEILYFGATWCSPCQQMKKLFKDGEVKKMLDKYDFQMYDYDEDGAIFRKYGVSVVPTLIIKKDNKIIYRRSGSMSKKALIEILKKYE